MRLLKTMGAPPLCTRLAWHWSAILRSLRDRTQWASRVACHGQRWIDYQFVPEEVERAHMLRTIDTITA